MNFLDGECGEVSRTVPCGEIVGHNVPVEHGNCCLGKLEINANMQSCGHVHGYGNEACEMDGAGDADKAYILLRAEINGSVLHWEEQGWIASNGGIVDACARQVMVIDDGSNSNFSNLSFTLPLGLIAFGERRGVNPFLPPQKTHWTLVNIRCIVFVIFL